MSKRGMMDQFTDIKTEHPDSVLFFRMGDFYELFHEDAVTGSEVLGLALTSRDKKADKPIKMAGFPWHALGRLHLRAMLKAGHKVTVAEQEQELTRRERSSWSGYRHSSLHARESVRRVAPWY